MQKARWLQSREITERIVVTGHLVLETPVYFGGGDDSSMVDMPLLLDPLEGRALLTGASLAGALRHYLREREHGYRKEGNESSLETLLFGFQKDSDGAQSWLIISDALAEVGFRPDTEKKQLALNDHVIVNYTRPWLELRDGVAINHTTRTADYKYKYDMELLAAAAGVAFPLRLELLVRESDREQLLRALAIALEGLEKGEIALGARKSRGFGRCRVKHWQVCCYDFSRPEGLLDWLSGSEGEKQSGTDISSLLGAQNVDLDKRSAIFLNATFKLDGTLIIRSSSGASDSPDTAHLHSWRGDKIVPILSGASLAGALRSRALRIAKTFGDSAVANELITDLFGPDKQNENPKASRLIVEEKEIINPSEMVVNRVKIDRFTGGAYRSALFDESPIFGLNETQVQIDLMVQNPKDEDVGLLLLLLKDLWTGDLPLGGETGIGRGRLKGLEARLTGKNNGLFEKEWLLKRSTDDRLIIEGNSQDLLEAYVQSFIREVSRIDN